MKTSVIRNSWMEENGFRLDTSPYLGGALETKMLLAKLPLTKTLVRDLVSPNFGGIYFAGRESVHWVDAPEYGVPIISGSDLQKADLSNMPLVSKRQVEENPTFSIFKGMTLITRSGTIGKTAYARAEMVGMATSDPLRVVPDPQKVAPGYLYAYLSSKFGIPLIASGASGAIIKHLDPDDIASIPVPRLGDALEHEVHTLVEQAGELLTEHSHQLAKATKLFFECVGLKDITSIEWHANKSRDLGFAATFPFPYSIRAIHFAPRFRKLWDDIAKLRNLPLGEICLPGTLGGGPRFKRIDAAPEHAIRLVGQRELFNLKPEGRLIAVTSVGEEVRMAEGTIAVAAQGTFGETELYCRSQFIWGNWTEYAYSQHMLRVVADESKMLRGCLFAFFRSETAFRMLRAISTGAKLQDNHYYFLPRLPIPIPQTKDQEEIHSMVVSAFEKRQQAVVNEDRAVAIIENAVDGYGK
jgi:hypothetical protein